MPLRETYKGLDKIALFIVGEKGINDTLGDRLAAAIQYWTSQSNTSVVFATIFSTIGISFLLTFSGSTKLVSIPIFISFLYFALRAWACGRCARIACSSWK